MVGTRNVALMAFTVARGEPIVSLDPRHSIPGKQPVKTANPPQKRRGVRCERSVLVESPVRTARPHTDQSFTPSGWRLGTRPRGVPPGFPQAGTGDSAVVPRTWFDTCPGRPDRNFTNIINALLTHAPAGFERGPCRNVIKRARISNSSWSRGYLINRDRPAVPAKIHFVGVVGGPRYGLALRPISGGGYCPLRRIGL